jgi:chromosome segregation ATPase
MSTPEPARIRALVQQETGWDCEALFVEMEATPQKMYALRQKIAPLRAEMKMLEDRFASKGRSPSHWDIERGLLLSELKEEARIIYARDPDLKTDAKGNESVIPLTDGRAEDIAHAHPRYRKFVEESQADRRRIREIGGEVGKLYDRLEAWKGRREFLRSKLEQIKAETYLLSSQMKL